MEERINVVIRLADGNVAIVYRDQRVVVVDRAGRVTREHADATPSPACASPQVPRDRLH